MEKVVATVSGYQGTERFNLIKLIAKAGGNYVGTMSDSITHLVCWRFEGRKFELAKKSRNTFIVNHRWIEDCIKKGRRVPEHPYTVKCGKEVGPLLMNITQVGESNQSSGCNHKEPQIDTEVEEYFPDPDIDKPKSRKKMKNRSRKYDRNLSSRVDHYDSSMSGSWRMETEELSPEPAVFLKPKKGSVDFPETSHKRRRLVKKNISDVLEISDSEELSPQIRTLPEHESAMQSNTANIGRHDHTSNNSQTTKLSCPEEDHANGIEVPGDTEEVRNVTNVETLENEGALASPFKSPLEQRQILDVDQKVDENCAKLPTSPALSCVICWTDFSSSRGLLPCGHRFCFSCIQSWADQMVSRGKTSTCPLCKVGFTSITKVADAEPSDQKIYSQTVPHDRPGTDIYLLPDGETSHFPANPAMPPVCCQCSFREPEELLINCHVCQTRCIHAYCLDPPLHPWTCIHCQDYQRRFETYRRIW
nr:brct domain-containing protein [Ipomoea batatas]